MDEQKKKPRSRVRNDILLIGGLLLIALIGIVYLFFFRNHGDTVKVTVDGKTYGVYSLSENRREEIKSGQNGEESNILVIKSGRAFMESASCPDGICVSHHKIFRDGESIVCLPNRVVATVISDKGDSPDIVS